MVRLEQLNKANRFLQHRRLQSNVKINDSSGGFGIELRKTHIKVGSSRN